MLTKVAPDGQQTSLIIVTLKEESIKEGTLYGVLENLKKQVGRADRSPAKLTFQLSGVPVIQQEIRNSINHDAVVFNIGGFLAWHADQLLFHSPLRTRYHGIDCQHIRQYLGAWHPWAFWLDPERLHDHCAAADHGDRRL